MKPTIHASKIIHRDRFDHHFERRTMDASVRRHVHGKILPMSQPSLLSRLFGRKAHGG